MKLYNSLTRSKEEFSPHGPEVTVYVCGITPYDTTHLGHAFTYTVYDQLIRYLELQGTRVRYTQNVTDIDDDILKRAGESGEDWRALGQRWTEHFIDDMIALNIRPPDSFPRATEVIPEITAWVQDLLRAGVAYESGGSVYYEVRRYPDFGQLSGLPREEMLPVANERGNRPEDPHKRHPLDFVLWQAQAPGEPAWESPWGPGRPGWHIECSTMATKFLGQTVDIHGGGMDLCFPHHECEIAQVKPLRPDEPYVRFWMHTAMVGYQGEKMSKSLGNLIMVRDLLQTYPADALRLYQGSHHYRAEWSYEEEDLRKCQALAAQLRQAASARGGSGEALAPDETTAAFHRAMQDDLDTPAALRALTTLAQSILDSAARQDVQPAQQTLRRLGSVFGLTLDETGPEARVPAGWEGKK
jgi:L-cysteine:1D-myo-inositol 2-amino-2-deoxy-alpha-D-glucopyranoside ligase